MDHLWDATIYGGFAGLTTLIGIYLVLMKEVWVRRGSVYLIGFASGALLSAALLDILPESLELNSNASLYLLSEDRFPLSTRWRDHRSQLPREHNHRGRGRSDDRGFRLPPRYHRTAIPRATPST